MPDPEWIKIKFAPGIFPDEAPSEAEAHWKDGSWIDFVLTGAGRVPALEVIRGWEKVTTATFAGKIRKILQHTTNAGYPATFLGGHTSTWAYKDAAMYFTTPVVSYGQLTNPFTVASIGTATVSVNHTAHGRATGDYVNFPESPVVTGSGITLTSGKYAVTKTDADNYTIQAPTVSTGTASGVGGTLDYEYFLAAGNEFGLGGAGYGTGTFGSGLYGRSSGSTFNARTWTAGMLGQNVIAAPRDGGVYELAPYYDSITELVTNGTFNGNDTGWTKGDGTWAYGTNNEVATNSSSALSQSISVTAGTWNLLKFTVTRSGGSVQASVNGTNVGSAISAAGRQFIRFWGGLGGTQTLAFTGSTFSGTIASVSTKILGTFAPITNAPTQVTGVLVTSKGHVECFGAIPSGKSAFDPMCIKSSDAFNNQNWTISATTEAREDFLSSGSRIITGLVGGDQTFYITDTSFIQRDYRGLATLVWSTTEKGSDCGAFGINSACYAASRVWWMGNNRTFWVYDGTAPKPLTCPGTKWVFDNIQFIQEDLVQCWHNAQRKQVWWEWPDRRDGTNELSRYAAYNYMTDAWIFGVRPAVRTAVGEAKTRGGYPMAAGTDGILYNHEKGDTADGSALSWFARSGAFDIGDGNTLAEVSGYIPDTQDQGGAYSIRFYGYEFNQNSTPEDSGALTVMPATTNLMNFFVQGRQLEWELRGNDAPARLRIGDPRFLIQDTGNQF